MHCNFHILDIYESYKIHTYAHRIWDYVKDIQYLIQQNSYLVMNNDLSLMFPVHVLTSSWSSSGRCIQRHTSTTNFARDVCVCVELKKVESMH